MDEQLEQTLQTLQHAVDATRRYNAAVWVGFWGNEQAAPVLSQVMLHHEDWGTRQNAAWAAGQAQLTACVPALQTIITKSGEDEQVRYVAALALVRVNHSDALRYLQHHTHSAEETVRRVAAAAIRTADYLAR